LSNCYAQLMSINLPAPTALARISSRTRKDGTPFLRVAILERGVEPQWRTYEHEVGCETDRVIARALRSSGVPAAWVWGTLPGVWLR
jgi:hypothetical protein